MASETKVAIILPICKGKECDLYPEFGTLVQCGYFLGRACMREDWDR